MKGKAATRNPLALVSARRSCTTHVIRGWAFTMWVLVACSAYGQLSGYSHVQELYIDFDQVSGTSNLSNFPVLVSLTEDYLRSTGNGGDVTSTSGYDIAFSVDGTTQLDHEIETYTASSGEYIAWVNIPTLYYDQYTVVYMSYGNASVITDPSTTATWDSNFQGVWHLNEETGGTGTVGLYQDATANNHDGDDQVSATGTEGQIGRGQQFDGTDDYIDMGNVLDYGESDAITYSAWIRTTGGWMQMAGKARHNVNFRGQWFYIENDGGLSYYLYDNNGDFIGLWSTDTFNDDAWHYVTATYDGSGSVAGVKLYEGGVEITNFQGTYTGPLTGTVENTRSFNIGAANDGSGDQFDGFIDEVRLSNTVRSADWIATEYNNQSNPGSFLSIGSPPKPDGPAGVGSRNGSSKLVVWLDANTIDQLDGTDVVTWTDQSGHGNDAIGNAYSDGSSPEYHVGALNGHPQVEFTAANSDYAEVAADATLDSDVVSVFVVGNITGASEDYGGFLIKDGGGWDDGWGIGRGDAGGGDQEQLLGFISDYTSNRVDVPITYGQQSIYSMIYDKTQIEFYTNENTPQTDAHTADIALNANGIFIGWTSAYMDGDISEIIVMDEAVNDAERIIMHNYLSAKYDIALTDNDVYDEDGNFAGDYDFEVAGIGRVDASNIIDDAQGTGIVRMLNPSNLDDDEFLIWGHDGGALTGTETSDVPPGILSRLERVWRVSEANSSGAAVGVGTVDVRFDLNGIEPEQASDLRLLVDTDGDASFADETPHSGAVALGGGIYEFTAATPIANNRRFTLGTVNSVLPIELRHFDAVADETQRRVLLNWSTATETNNDFFTIERSKDAKDWKPMLIIPGAGNSKELLVYAATDEDPYAGVSYYRLKQTDFDGQFSYSPVKTVTIGANGILSLYPNPATNTLIVHGESVDTRDVHIYNVLGQDVSDLVRLQGNDQPHHFALDISGLSPGIYSLQSQHSSLKFIKKEE